MLKNIATTAISIPIGTYVQSYCPHCGRVNAEQIMFSRSDNKYTVACHSSKCNQTYVIEAAAHVTAVSMKILIPNLLGPLEDDSNDGPEEPPDYSMNHDPGGLDDPIPF